MKTLWHALKKGSNHAFTGAKSSDQNSPIMKMMLGRGRSYYTSAYLSLSRGGRPYSSEASTAVASTSQIEADVFWHGLRGSPPLNGLAQRKLADRVSLVNAVIFHALTQNIGSFLRCS